METAGSGTFSKPIHQRHKHSPQYIKIGSLANLSSHQAQKAINYIKGEQQMLSQWIYVASKKRSPIRLTVALAVAG